MIEVPSAVGLLGTLLVIAAALGAIAATFRTSTLRNTIGDQKQSIDALETRVRLAEEGETRANIRCDTLEAQVGALKEANSALASTITGATKLTDIARAQVEFANLADQRHSEIVSLLAQLIGRPS